MAIESSTKDLIGCWVIAGIAVLLLFLDFGFAYAYGSEFQAKYAIAEGQRIWLRTLSYSLAIVSFPLTNLIRHIQLRLNQTMPGITSPKKRYLSTVLVSMILVQGSGLLGVFMFCSGDSYNTLNILLGMSALGIYLYRPKSDELISIVEALSKDK